METVRNYVHKTHGDIGRVVLSADVTKVTLNGKALPETSVEYLLNFALQSLQDAYAGAKTEGEAKAMFEKRLDRLMEGKIGVREGGTSVSEFDRVAIALVREVLRAKLDKEVYEAKYKDDAEACLEVFVKNREKLEPEVRARVKVLEEKRAKRAALAKSSDLDL